jgi:cell division protein FtsQ
VIRRRRGSARPAAGPLASGPAAAGPGAAGAAGSPVAGTAAAGPVAGTGTGTVASPAVAGSSTVAGSGVFPVGVASSSSSSSSSASAAAVPTAGFPPGSGSDALPRRRGIDRWKAAFFGLAVLAIVAGAAWALLGSKFFVVRSVAVTGPPAVSRAEVIADAGIRLGTPLVRIDPAAVARRVERITLVQSAQVRRAWPDKIVISVVERKAVFVMASGHGYQEVDRFGVILRHVGARPRGMPVLDTSGPALRGSPAVLAAAAVLHELPARLARSVRAVDAASATAVTLRLHGKITIVWGGTGQPAAKARELAILMRGHARYYDISDPQTAVTGG